MRDRLIDIYDRLLERYGPRDWWPADSRFEVMVGADPRTEHRVEQRREGYPCPLGRWTSFSSKRCRNADQR